MNTRPLTLSLGERQTNLRTPYPKSTYVAALFFTLLMLPIFQALFEYHIMRYLVPIWLLWALIFSLESRGVWGILLSSRRFELFFFALWCLVLIIYPLVNPKLIKLHVQFGDLSEIPYDMVPIIMSYLMGMAYRARGEARVFHILAVVLLVALAINCIIATPILLGGGLQIRAQLHDYQEMNKAQIGLGYFGLGGLGFYGGMVLLVPFFLNLIVGAKGFARLILLALLIPIVINLYLCGLLIIMGTLGFSFCLYFFLVMGKKRFKGRKVLAVILVGTILLFIGYNLSGEISIQYQLRKLDAALNPTSSGTALDSHKRKLRYRESIETFLAFPFFGAGGDANAEELRHRAIGGHSGVLDALGLYGMFFTIYLVFLAIKLRHLRALNREDDQSLWYTPALVSLCSYFMLILMDPLLLDPYTGWILFFFVLGPAHLLTGPRRQASMMLEKSGTIGPVRA